MNRNRSGVTSLLAQRHPTPEVREFVRAIQFEEDEPCMFSPAVDRYIDLAALCIGGFGFIYFLAHIIVWILRS